MKNIQAVVAAASVGFASFAVPAFAGGMATPVPEPVVVAPEPVMVAPSGDWSGFYVGAQLGYGDVDSNGNGLDGNGGLGGVHAGHRYDFGRFVAGAELDYDKTQIDLGTAGDQLDSVTRLKFIGGADLGRSLVYATAGAAQAKATVGGNGLSDTGYFLGAGIDYAITDRWYLGGELLQHKFDNYDGTGVDLDATTVTARVSLKF